MAPSLWGEAFDFEPSPQRVKKLVSSVNKPKSPKITTEKAIKSKTVSLEDKLALIESEVIRILGSYKSNTVVIDSYDKFVSYIDAAIDNGAIAIDTETNNSLDPLTCKLMGLCLYTPGQKNAYIPVNHIDYHTGERLFWQITEEQIQEQLERLNKNNVLQILHNAKFDYQVLKCTCKCQLQIYWDTLIGARILNENELAGLKGQYIDKIDSTIEHYNIEHLFDIEYAIVPPKLFALYAATDAYMTYKLYEWQKAQFKLPENSGIYNCFKVVEMPCVEVIAEMELYGVGIDREYAVKLSNYYHKEYDKLQEELNVLLDQYRPQIAEWRLTPAAQERPRVYLSSEKKITDDIRAKYPNYDQEKRDWYKEKKSKSEQLVDPVSVDAFNSPTQLAIILYDVLNCEPGLADAASDKRKSNYIPSRGTGEEYLEKINEKYDIPLCKKILSNREFLKLINTYIDNIPKATNISDDRIHTHFNQIGAGTGRTSSSDPVNL